MVCTNPLPMCWCTRTPEHRARELILATVSEGERACAWLHKPPVGLIGGAAEEVVLSPVRPSVPETDSYIFCSGLR